MAENFGQKTYIQMLEEGDFSNEKKICNILAKYYNQIENELEQSIEQKIFTLINKDNVDYVLKICIEEYQSLPILKYCIESFTDCIKVPDAQYIKSHAGHWRYKELVKQIPDRNLRKNAEGHAVRNVITQIVSNVNISTFSQIIQSKIERLKFSKRTKEEVLRFKHSALLENGDNGYKRTQLHIANKGSDSDIKNATAIKYIEKKITILEKIADIVIAEEKKLGIKQPSNIIQSEIISTDNSIEHDNSIAKIQQELIAKTKKEEEQGSLMLKMMAQMEAMNKELMSLKNKSSVVVDLDEDKKPRGRPVGS